MAKVMNSDESSSDSSNADRKGYASLSVLALGGNDPRLPHVLTLQRWARGHSVRSWKMRRVRADEVVMHLMKKRYIATSYCNLLAYSLFLCTFVMLIWLQQRTSSMYAVQLGISNFVENNMPFYPDGLYSPTSEVAIDDGYADTCLAGNSKDEIFGAMIETFATLGTVFEYQPQGDPSYFQDVNSREDVLDFAEAAGFNLIADLKSGVALQGYGSNEVMGTYLLNPGVVVTLSGRVEEECRNMFNEEVTCVTETVDDTPLGPDLNGSRFDYCPPIYFEPEVGGYFSFAPAPNVVKPVNVVLWWPLLFESFRRVSAIEHPRSRMAIDFTLENPSIGLISAVSIEFTWSTAGVVERTVKVDSIYRNDCSMDVSWCETGQEKLRFVVEWLFRIQIVGYVVLKLSELFGHRSQCPRRSLNGYWNTWQLLDWANLALYLATQIWWLAWSGAIVDRLNTFEDEVNTLRLQWENLNETINAENEDANLAGSLLILRMVQSVRNEALSFEVYSVLQSISLAISLVRLFKFFLFQPKLSQVTHTVKRALDDLLHFIIVFMMILVVYAFIGNCLFGSRVEAFSNIGLSIITLFAWLFGDFDSSLFEQFFIAGRLYFIIFMIWVVLILVNMFLAIVMDSYSDHKTGTKATDNVWDEVREIVVMGIYHAYECTRGFCSKTYEPSHLSLRQQIKIVASWAQTVKEPYIPVLQVYASLLKILPRYDATALTKDLFAKTQPPRKGLPSTIRHVKLHVELLELETDDVKFEVEQVSHAVDRIEKLLSAMATKDGLADKVISCPTRSALQKQRLKRRESKLSKIREIDELGSTALNDTEE